MICHLMKPFFVARPVRVRIPVVSLLFWCLISGANGEAPPGAAGETPERLDAAGDINLRIRQRKVIDRYTAKFHALEKDFQPSSIRPRPRFEPEPRKLKLLRPELAEPVLNYRVNLPEKLRPMRSFRAPILAERNKTRLVTLTGQQLTKPESRAAAYIEERLAEETLLPTLARVIEILGADESDRRIRQVATRK
jgi:hypothetical protein